MKTIKLILLLTNSIVLLFAFGENPKTLDRIDYQHKQLLIQQQSLKQASLKIKELEDRLSLQESNVEGVYLLVDRVNNKKYKIVEEQIK